MRLEKNVAEGQRKVASDHAVSIPEPIGTAGGDKNL